LLTSALENFSYINLGNNTKQGIQGIMWQKKAAVRKFKHVAKLVLGGYFHSLLPYFNKRFNDLQIMFENTSCWMVASFHEIFQKAIGQMSARIGVLKKTTIRLIIKLNNITKRWLCDVPLE
jgi:hypothetical protein